MELSVGMYVRNKGGFIDKIISFKRTITNDYVELEDEYYANKRDILKASYNIIDLIEVGDYVNGNKIVHIQEEEYPYYPKRLIFAGVDINNPDDVWECYNNDDIKSIVTKEMFSSVEYRVETN